MFDLNSRPTGIFARNDLSALGVLFAAREGGLHVPEDLSVVWFRRHLPERVDHSRADDPAPVAYGNGQVAMQVLLGSGRRGEPRNRRVSSLPRTSWCARAPHHPGGLGPRVSNFRSRAVLDSATPSANPYLSSALSENEGGHSFQGATGRRKTGETAVGYPTVTVGYGLCQLAGEPWKRLLGGPVTGAS